MIKETTVQKDVVEKHRYCDVCGSGLHWDLACIAACCECCGKDLCERCVGHEGYAAGDYRVVYCGQCWKISAPYRKVIAELESLIDELYSDCSQEIKDRNIT